MKTFFWKLTHFSKDATIYQLGFKSGVFLLSSRETLFEKVGDAGLGVMVNLPLCRGENKHGLKRLHGASHLSPSLQVRKITTVFCFVLTCTFSRSACNNKQQVQCIFTYADILEPGCSCDKLRRSRRPSLANDTSSRRLELMLLQYCLRIKDKFCSTLLSHVSSLSFKVLQEYRVKIFWELATLRMDNTL